MNQFLEESLFFLVIRNQHILGLTIVTQHHFVVFSTNSGLFVTTKRCTRRIRMVLIYPNSTSLNGSWYLIQFVCITCPNASTQSVQSIVSNFNCFFNGFKGGNCQNRSKDFFLEDTHLVVPFKQSRFDVVTIFQVAI